MFLLFFTLNHIVFHFRSYVKKIDRIVSERIEFIALVRYAYNSRNTANVIMLII